jgi:hypothetical protein
VQRWLDHWPLGQGLDERCAERRLPGPLSWPRGPGRTLARRAWRRPRLGSANDLRAHQGERVPAQPLSSSSHLTRLVSQYVRYQFDASEAARRRSREARWHLRGLGQLERSRPPVCRPSTQALGVAAPCSATSLTMRFEGVAGPEFLGTSTAAVPCLFPIRSPLKGQDAAAGAPPSTFAFCSWNSASEMTPRSLRSASLATWSAGDAVAAACTY